MASGKGRGGPPDARDTAAPDPITGALRAAERRLTEAGVPSPGFDARLLLRHTLGWSAAELTAFAGERTPAAAARSFAAGRREFRRLVRERAARRPLQHLVGSVEFFGLDLAVGPAALIPRPESEILVEAAIEWARGEPTAPRRIADVGAGAGGIALALASGIAGASVLMLDVSAPALRLAARNAVSTGLASRVWPVRADLLTPARPASLDLVAANLPYIPDAEIATLEPEVADHEPRLALAGGRDGLEPLRRLLPMAARALRPGGRLFVEIGAGQRAPAVRLLRAAGFGGLRARRDLAGVWRVLSAAPVASTP